MDREDQHETSYSDSGAAQEGKSPAPNPSLSWSSQKSAHQPTERPGGGPSQGSGSGSGLSAIYNALRTDSGSGSGSAFPPRPPPRDWSLALSADAPTNGTSSNGLWGGQPDRAGTWTSHRDRRHDFQHHRQAGGGQAHQEWGQLPRRGSPGSRSANNRHPSVGREPTSDWSASGSSYLSRSTLSRHPPPAPRPTPAASVRRIPGAQQTQVPEADDFLAKFKDLAVNTESLPPLPPSARKVNAEHDWSWIDDFKDTIKDTEPTGSMEAEEKYIPVPTLSDSVEEDTRRRQRKAEKRKAKSQKPKNTLYRSREAENDGGYEYYDEDEVYRQERRQQKEAKRRAAEELEAAPPTSIFLPELISVGNLGAALKVKPTVFLQQLLELGFEDITLESIMTGETAALIAQEYNFEPTVDTGSAVDLKPQPVSEDTSSLPPRPPIVTIMGHVDHGKTTMLDWLRKSSVAAQEHGGITQHIGAFSVKLSTGKRITFLDTPGHAAFLSMRQRGANVTDIVILVVAADDSVKPQTLEALKHARGAKVPIIVAINKVDKDEANIQRVKADLAGHGIEIEDYGGDVQVVCVSGKTGQGMDDLEENILTLSEILDMRADPGGMAEGWVIESSIKPIGRIATVLITRGTLRKGDIIVAGTAWARIRMLRNEAGVEVEEAGPATPVEILGWDDEPPAAGQGMLQAPNEDKAKAAVRYRNEMVDREAAAADIALQLKKEKEKAELAALAEAQGEVAEEGEQKVDDGPKMVTFTVKGDVMGSVEAVAAAVMEIGSNEVRPMILRSAPGYISEFDVEHAATSNSYIINFNNPVPPHIQRMAEDAGVKILDHSVIYHLVDDVKAKLSELLPPTVTIKVLAEAEVLQVFPINLKGRVYKNIAGCRVRNGQITRNALFRVSRRGEVIFDGKLAALKQGKKDATEIRKGTECGMEFEEFQDLQQGDIVQSYEEIMEKRQL